MEVDELFESLTIKELKQQNIKTRTEIESKKEELRFLVGERYRDIIDAADTIFEMKACSNEITDSLKCIKVLSKKWNTTLSCKYSIQNNVNDSNMNELQYRYSVAAQIKLLLNMSELIWNAMENSAFSEAAMLFNVCRNMFIHSHLSYDKYKNNDFDMQLIFSRQWDSLQNLEDTISTVSRKYLKYYRKTQNVDDVIDCLVSIILLEDKDFEEVVKEYISCIECQLQEWFSSKSSVVQINYQLCSVASIIMDTINMIYSLFIEKRILVRIEEMSNIIVQNMDYVKEERIYQYLPEQISKFKPALKPFQRNSSGVSDDRIIDLTKDWLHRVCIKYEVDFTESFSHLTTIKSVGETRSELRKIFNDESNAGVDTPWHQLQLDNSIEWNKHIYGIYSKKLQVIIHEEISKLFLNWTVAIEKFITLNENLMSEDEFNEDSFFNYFWTECNKDAYFNSENSTNSNLIDGAQTENKMIFQSLYNHFSNYFDVGPLVSNKNCNFESLVIKSKNIRPEIYQITKIFNDDLLKLIVEIIDTVIDCEQFLSTVLQECLSLIISKCTVWIDSVTKTDISVSSISKEKFKKEKEFPHIKMESETLINCHQFKLIILSQSVRTLYETFPSLQAGLMISAITGNESKTIYSGTKVTSKIKSKTQRLPYLPGKRLQHQADFEYLMWNTWNGSVEALKSSVNKFITCGIKPSIISLIGEYFEHVKASFISVNICEYLATKWTDMKLENTESESAIPLSLAVPSQCSWLMHRLLISICRLLTIFGGHSISRVNLDQIRLEILKVLIEQYELMRESDEYQENKTHQKQNIQLIFDLRIFLEIINAKTGIQKDIQDKLRSILTEIEGCVDPFDFNMMNETLHQNLTQSVAKTSSLYLLLSSNVSKKNTSIAQRLETGTNQHNLIDLVGTVGNKHSKSSIRFGMLPISGYMVPSKSTTPADSARDLTKLTDRAPLCEPKHIIVKATKSSADSTVLSNSKSRSYYLGRLGSNWF